MAKGVYACIDGVSRNVKQIPLCIDGVSRNTKTGYACIDGVSRAFFPSETLIGTLSVGTSVYMNVNGVRKEFLIVNQGRPSTAYDTSCDGTWLLMKDIYSKRAWDSTNHDYANSDIRSYLNGTFLGLFDSGVQSIIKQVKLPYRKGTGASMTVSSGANGLSAKVFLLSASEVGSINTAIESNVMYIPLEGARLSEMTTYASRIAYFNGTATDWWLRTPDAANNLFVTHVNENGNVNRATYINATYGALLGVRPALILPSTTLVDESFNIIA